MIRNTVKRVVSLLPSATEALVLAGGEHLLVGRSHECDFPSSIQHLPVLTGQKTEFTTSKDVDRQVREYLKDGDGSSLYLLDVPLLKSLQPDLIITQDLCDVCAIDIMTVRRVAYSMNPRPEVLSLNPQNIQGIFENVLEVGKAIDHLNQAETAVQQLKSRIEEAINLRHSINDMDGTGETTDTLKPKVLFIEWIDPPFVGGHWTPQLIDWAGGTQPLNPSPSSLLKGMDWQVTKGGGKSFPVEPQQCIDVQPDKIIIAPCGLDVPTTELELNRMIRESPDEIAWLFGLEAFQNGDLALVDGNVMFNRPGPRVVDALEFLVGFLNDDENAIPENFPWKRLLPSHVQVPEFTLPRPPPAPQAIPVEVQIEEAHKAACDAKESFYKDPKTGLMVMTEFYIRQRGVCCGNACRHCPYGHMNVKDTSRRQNTLRSPVVLLPPGRKKQNGSTQNQLGGEECVIMCWSGGKDSFLALTEIQRENPSTPVVLMTTINENSGTVPIQEVTSQEISDQAAALGLPVCFVPLPDGCPNDQYVIKVREGLDTVCKSLRLRPTRMAFGDLFLEDIKQWRVSMFHHTGQFADIELVFPLWKRDYQQDLLPLLWQRLQELNAEVTISSVGNSINGGSGQTCIRKGQIFEEGLLSTFSDEIDVMGENGEFHTHVKFKS